MTATPKNLTVDLGYLEAAAARGSFAKHVVEVLQQELPAPAKAFETLLEALGDVPRLVETAKAGLLDRALIQQRAGQQERCDTVQQLHEPIETLPGLVVCAHCSELAGRPIPYACPTIARHDG
jgi:hypothetical protein